METDTFSKMLCNATNITPEQGDKNGTCCICGQTTRKGFKKKFSGNFTGADFLLSGEVLCPECHYMVGQSNNLRRTMFLLTHDEFKKFKKKDLKKILFNLPTDKDYYLYLTKTWQKVGYLLMNNARNIKGCKNITTYMDYDKIHFTIPALNEYYKIAQQLRKLKISKKVLENGGYSLYDYKIIHEAYPDCTRSIIRQLSQLRGNPIWELAVYMTD